MKGRQRYRHVASSRAERKEDRPLIFSGVLGVTTNAENQVEVPDRPGYVWVRLRNQLNELIQAFNESVSPVFGLPVLVEWDKNNPIRYKVLGRDAGRYTVWGGGTSDVSAYLPRHGAQHQFDTLTGIGGGDVVWVYGQQFMPWLITPSGSSGALSVSMQPGAYYYDQEFRWAGGTGIAGFDTLRPTGSSNARMLLVYLDPDTGNPYLATGTLTEFANTITGTAQIMPYIPSLIEPTDIPLAGVRLITGSSALLWPNIYDLRDYFSHSSVSGTTGGGNGAPTDAQYVVMALNGTLTDERVLTAGTDIDVDDSGAGGNATVSVPTGTFSKPGHTHYSAEVTDLEHAIPIFEDSVFQATGTIIDFGENVNVAVTGSTVFVSTVDTQGGGDGDLLIYDDSVFKVTGTAISFDDNLDVHVTGSIAYIEGTGGAQGPPGDNTILVYDDSIFKATGSAISFDDNLDVHVTGSTVFVDGQAGGGGAGGYPAIYDDSVFIVTGASINFEDGIDVSSTGTTAHVKYPIPEIVGHPDTPPSSPHAKDDEFNADTLDAKWSWVNQGSGTVDLESYHSVLLMRTTAYAGDSIRIIEQDMPTGTFTFVGKFAIARQGENYSGVGLCARDSSSGRVVANYFDYNQSDFAVCGTGVNVENFNSPTSWNARVGGTEFAGNYIYLKWIDDGTNFKFYFSPDGRCWAWVLSTSRTAWLASPDKIGISWALNNNTFDLEAVCEWFRVTEP